MRRRNDQTGAGVSTETGYRETGVANRTAMAIVSVWTIAISAAGCSGNQIEDARQAHQPIAPPKTVSAVSSPPPVFNALAQSQAVLRKLRNELNALAERNLAGVDLSDGNDVDVPGQTLVVESAKAAQQDAVFDREAAEIALKEYEETVFPQEKKTCDAEIQIAQAELQQASKAVEPAKERYIQIQQHSDTSATNLVLQWQYQFGVTSAELKLRKAKFALEQAESRRRVLLEYEHGKRLKELKSAIEKARSAELQRRAVVQREESKLKQMQEPANRLRPLTESQKEILALLDRAIGLVPQLTDRIDSVQKEKSQGDSVLKEIGELTQQLQDIVNEAHDVESTNALNRLKSGLGRGFLRSNPGLDATRAALGADVTSASASADQPTARAELTAREFLQRTRDRLRALESSVVALGAEALRSHFTDAVRSDRLVNQRITEKSAEANYENAKLKREVAEIGLVEYEEGIFKQDEATVEGEERLADTEAARAVDMIDMAELQLAEIKKRSAGSAQDLSWEYRFTDNLADARLHQPRAELAHEQALTKREVLRKYTKAIRVKQLKAAIEKTRSEELARKAIWERENLKVKRLQKPIGPSAGSAYLQRTRDLLKQAVAAIETLKLRIGEAEKNAHAAEPVRREIASLLKPIESLLDQATAEYGKSQWAELEPKVHEAAGRYLGAKT